MELKRQMFLIFLYLCSAAYAKDECLDGVLASSHRSFKSNHLIVSECNSSLGGTSSLVMEEKLQDLVPLLFNKSFEYLILANNFNSYQKNRPGLSKLFKSISKQMLKDVIYLIKKITGRGSIINFDSDYDSSRGNLDLNEIQSLALTLDNTKNLIQRMSEIYSSRRLDPHFAHYIKKQFLPAQIEILRKISGYVNDLMRMLHPADHGDHLALHLFDQYLSKEY